MDIARIGVEQLEASFTGCEINGLTETQELDGDDLSGHRAHRFEGARVEGEKACR